MAAGLIVLDWKVLIGWFGLTWGVIIPGTGLCTFCSWFWGTILLLNSPVPGKGDITACGVALRGVSPGIGIGNGIFWAS